MIETDVCIIGAGPGGCATALKLNKLNIPCVLVDKSTFPRDKICGDALTPKAFHALREIAPGIINSLNDYQDNSITWGGRFVTSKNEEIDYDLPTDNEKRKRPWVILATRHHFDNLMIQEVKRKSNIRLIENTQINNFERSINGFTLTDREHKVSIKTKVLIDAAGENSLFTRKFCDHKRDLKHHAVAIRAYFRNVQGMDRINNLIEFHLLKKFSSSTNLPGYLWIFPMANNMANVGIGMRSDHLNLSGINLKEHFLEILENDTYLKERFRHAEMVGKIKGAGIPLSSNRMKISGANYLLVGDSASMAHPLSGEGIGIAMRSGIEAAKQVKVSLQNQDFSLEGMKLYEHRMDKILKSPRTRGYRAQRLLQKIWFRSLLENFLVSNRNRLHWWRRNLLGTYKKIRQMKKELFAG